MFILYYLCIPPKVVQILRVQRSYQVTTMVQVLFGYIFQLQIQRIHYKIKYIINCEIINYQNKLMQVQTSQLFGHRNDFDSSSSNFGSEQNQKQPLVEEINESPENSMRLISKNSSQSQSSPTHADCNSHSKQRAYYTKQQIYNHDIVYVNSDEFSNSPSFLKMSIENTPILRKKDSLNISCMPGINNNSTNTIAYVPNYEQSNQLDCTIRLDDIKRSSNKEQGNLLKQQSSQDKKFEENIMNRLKQKVSDSNSLRNQSFVEQQAKNGNENKNKKRANPRNMIQNRNRSLSEYQIENIIKIVDSLYEKAIDKKIKVQVNLQIESKSLQKIRRQKQNKKQISLKENNTEKEDRKIDGFVKMNKKQCLKQVTNIINEQRMRKILTSSKHSEQNEEKQVDEKPIRCSINLQQLKLMKQIKQIYKKQTEQNQTQQQHQQENEEYQNYNIKYYDIIVNQNDDDKGLSTTQRVSIQVLPQEYKCKEQDQFDEELQLEQYSSKQQQNLEGVCRRQSQHSSQSEHSYGQGKINTYISSQKWFKTDSQPQQNRIENPLLQTVQVGTKINYQVYPCECLCQKSIETNTNSKKSCRKVYIKNNNSQVGAITPIKNMNNSHINSSHFNSRNHSATSNAGNSSIIKLIQLDPSRAHKHGRNEHLEFGDDSQNRQASATMKKNTNKNVKNINYTLIKYEQNEQNKQVVNTIKYIPNTSEKNKQNKTNQYLINNNLSLPTQVYTNISIRTNLNHIKQFEPESSANLLQLCQQIKQQDKEIQKFAPSTQRRAYFDSKINSGSVTDRLGVENKQNKYLNKYDLNVMNAQAVGNKTDRTSGSTGRTNRNSSRTNKSTTSKNNMYKGVYEQILSEYSTAKLLAISKQQYSHENVANVQQQASGVSMSKGQLYPHCHSSNNSASNSNIIRNSNAYQANYNENIEVGSIIKNTQNKSKNIVKNIISNRKQQNNCRNNGGIGVCFINEQPQICSYGTYNGKHTNANHNLGKTGNNTKQQHKSNKYYFQRNV